MNNLAKQINNLFQKTENVLINSGIHFTGMNILNFRDIDLWDVLLSDESDALTFIYNIGSSFYNMYDKYVVDSYMNGGFTVTNIKLLRRLGHPDFAPQYILLQEDATKSIYV